VNPPERGNAHPLKVIYLLSVANFVNVFGYGVYAYIFPNFLQVNGATAPDVGLVAEILMVAQAITYIPGGILSDAGHRRKLVISAWLFPIFATPFFIVTQLNNAWQ